MAKFFELENQFTEDKIVGRLERIYADTMKIPADSPVYSVMTKSKAPLQKIKFFLDAIEVRVFGPDYADDPTDFEDKVLKVGKWFEMEDQENGVHFNSAGFFYFTFSCTPGPGSYAWKLTTLQNNLPLKEVLFIYISAISFSDSFVKAASGWFDPANPENLIARTQPEIQPGLPDGAELNDFLVEGDDGPEWKNGIEVVPFLPYPVVPDSTANPPILARRGPVNIDGQRMIIDNNGFIGPNIDGDTLYYDMDPNSASFRQLKAKQGGAGINYSETEQNTGIKWTDGKDIYQTTFVNRTGEIQIANVGWFIDVEGGQSYSGQVQNFQYFGAASNQYIALNMTTHVLRIIQQGGSTPCSVTVRYTKFNP